MKNNKIAFFYDFETLGQDMNNCVVLCCAGIAIDSKTFLEKEWQFDELYEKAKIIHFDCLEQKNEYGWQIEQGTCDWWENSVSKEVRKTIFKNADKRKSVKEFLPWLNSFDDINYGRVDKWMSRGQGFDMKIAHRLIAVSDTDINKHMPWWDTRDTRSFIEGLSYGTDISNKFIPTDNYAGLPDNPDLHDPITDIVVDVLRIQYLIRTLYI
jgi:hypothetical protein